MFMRDNFNCDDDCCLVFILTEIRMFCQCNVNENDGVINVGVCFSQVLFSENAILTSFVLTALYCAHRTRRDPGVLNPHRNEEEVMLLSWTMTREIMLDYRCSLKTQCTWKFK